MGLANSVYVPYPINTLDDNVSARKCATSAGTFHGMPASVEMPSRSSTAAMARIMKASRESLQLAHSSLSHDDVCGPRLELTGETEHRLWMHASFRHCLESLRFEVASRREQAGWRLQYLHDANAALSQTATHRRPPVAGSSDRLHQSLLRVNINGHTEWFDSH